MLLFALFNTFLYGFDSCENHIPICPRPGSFTVSELLISVWMCRSMRVCFEEGRDWHGAWKQDNAPECARVSAQRHTFLFQTANIRLCQDTGLESLINGGQSVPSWVLTCSYSYRWVLLDIASVQVLIICLVLYLQCKQYRWMCV